MNTIRDYLLNTTKAQQDADMAAMVEELRRFVRPTPSALELHRAKVDQLPYFTRL